VIAGFLALIERMAPRLTAAGTLFLFAAVASPYDVGIYNWVALAYTAFQAIFELPIRHVLIEVLKDPRSQLLRVYQFVAPAAGAAMITATVGLLYATGTAGGPEFFFLLIMGLAPIFTTMNLRFLGALQASESWRTLALGQLLASLGALVLVLPLLLVTHSVGAVASQPVISEALFYLWCRRAATSAPTVLLGRPHVALGRTFANMAAYSGLGWLQGQSDRVLIGAFAGPSTLGTFSVASALARSLGDPLASSTANILRARIGTGASSLDVRRTADSILQKALWLATGAVALSVVATELIARPILSDSWAPALEIVPILALSAVASPLTWSGSVLQALTGSAHRSFWAPTIGLTFAPVIALVAVTDLQFAAWLVVAREFVVALVSFTTVRRVAPWRALLLSLAIATVGSIFVVAFT
jgi:O-antigen/teichoic acid export membrane protein